MKTLKINKLLLFCIGLVVFNSCVEDDDFAVPDVSIEEPILDGPIIPISSVLGRLVQAQVDEGVDNNGNLNFNENSITYQYPDDVIEYMEGYVVSSDEAGNFFEELILQDRPENPTVGIKVPIDVNPLFTRYAIGRKVYVKVTNLHVGISNGVLAIGFKNGDFVSEIPFPLEPDVIKRSADKQEIVPLPMSISDLSQDKTNLFIQLQDVQFNEDEAGQISYASEPLDEFDGERVLESCSRGLISGSTTFSTSTFADFSGVPLPTGSGTVNGLLTRNFEGSQYNIVVNTLQDIQLTNEDRCIPFNINNFDIQYQETFNDGFNNGWEVANTEGTTSWRTSSFGGESYARASAFSRGSIVQMVSWLISPEFDFDAQDNELMIIEVADAFNNGEPLKAFYSTDYVPGSDPSTATWTEIGTEEIQALPDNTVFFDNVYDQTTPINLSDVVGSGFIAFVYDSNDATISSTIDLSDVKIITPKN